MTQASKLGILYDDDSTTYERLLESKTSEITTLVHFSAASLAAEVTETLPQALKRDPRTDGSYACLKGVLHPSPIQQM